MLRTSLRTILLSGPFLLAACSFAVRTAAPADGETIPVAASFYPLAHFAEQVGGERVSVHAITPEGADPHEYEPTPRDIGALYASRLFLFNGAGQDPWAERIRHDAERRGIIVLEMLDIIEPLAFEEEDVHEDEHDEEESEDAHDHGEYDPHAWLDPIHAITMIEAIRDALIGIDPDNEDFYSDNASSSIADLRSLHRAYAERLSSCALSDIIVAHDAFRYLAHRYGFETVAISGLSHEEEPSPRRMAEIATIAREKDIDVIFFETLASPRLSETIAREIGAETLVLNPIEGLTQEDHARGANYVTLMEENLENLRTALRCR